jgi:hypothetical protein
LIPATVIAELYEGADRITLAHAECARSQVVSTGAPAPAALTEPGTGTDMAALTGVLPGPDGPLPLLILDQRPEMVVRGGPAERVNLFVSALLSMGLTLVTTISGQLVQAMDGQAEALAHARRPAPSPGSFRPPRPRDGGLSCPPAAQHDLPPRTGRSYTAGNAASLGRGAR